MCQTPFVVLPRLVAQKPRMSSPSKLNWPPFTSGTLPLPTVLINRYAWQPEPMGETLREFVAEVRHLIDDWGIAGENLYWRPVLVLTVGPDGQKRAADLARLLKNSGLETSAGDVANKTTQGNTQ